MAENLAYVRCWFRLRCAIREDVIGRVLLHRHAAFHDQNRENWDEGIYHPLKSLQDKQAGFQCYDSVLSEEAVLAFDYGYATANPYELVVWEGQFGDFANGAQVVIDQFIASGEAKWGRACGLVMLLPRSMGMVRASSSPRTLHAGVRRNEHGSLRAVQCGPSFPHAAPSGSPHATEAAGRDDAEVVAAPQGCCFVHGRSGERRIPARYR